MAATTITIYQTTTMPFVTGAYIVMPLPLGVPALDYSEPLRRTFQVGIPGRAGGAGDAICS